MYVNELAQSGTAMQEAMIKLQKNYSPSGFLGFAGDKLKWVKKYTLDAAEKAYQMEDSVFRLAVYMDRLDKGLSPEQADVISSDYSSKLEGAKGKVEEGEIITDKEYYVNYERQCFKTNVWRSFLVFYNSKASYEFSCRRPNVFRCKSLDSRWRYL